VRVDILWCMNKKIVFAPTTVKRIVSLYVNGKTVAYIAEKFEVNHVVINRTLIENNISIRTKRVPRLFSKYEIKKIVSLYKNRTTTKELHKLFIYRI